MEHTRLMRSESDKMFAGVCGGIGAYLGVNSVFVRLAFLLLIFASGIGIPLYIILIFILPNESTVDQSGKTILQENINHIGDDAASGYRRFRQHPQGPAIAAALLIAFGLFLLMENLGFFGLLRPEFLLSLTLIGLGLYLLVKRGRS